MQQQVAMATKPVRPPVEAWVLVCAAAHGILTLLAAYAKFAQPDGGRLDASSIAVLAAFWAWPIWLLAFRKRSWGPAWALGLFAVGAAAIVCMIPGALFITALALGART